MRVARLLVHSSRGAGAGKGGRPWTDYRSERGADGATRGSGVRHVLLWMGVDGRRTRQMGAPYSAKTGTPGARRRKGTLQFRGGPHEQGLWGPGDSLRCCRMDSADGLSGNECKRLRVGAQAHRAVRGLPEGMSIGAVTSRYCL
jgi:hypothetical protein